jgi:hypothetical protein
MTPALVRSRVPAWLAAPLAWLFVTAPAASASEACSLQPVPIQPVSSEPANTYIGRTAVLELRFHNDKTSGPVDVFPEPPLMVKRLDTQTECAIQDGGIWVRRHVWASADGRTLVTHEYSGSNDELVFHDTRSCARTAVVDVSNTRWTIEGGAVIKSAAKGTKRPSSVRLDAACLPAKPAGSSTRR